MTSLNPVFTIGNQVEEPLRAHRARAGATCGRGRWTPCAA